METTLLQTLMPLGVGGVLAGMVLMWKRQDDIRYQSQLISLVESSTKAAEANTATLQEVAKALQELCLMQKFAERLEALDKKLETRSRKEAKSG